MPITAVRKLMSPPIGARRDLDALSRFHSAAYPILYRFIAFRMGDEKTAEKLTDELFIHLLEEPDTQPGDAEFPQKLLLLLASKAVGRYQRSGTHPMGTVISDVDIQNAMAKLPESYQILLALMYGCCLSIEEVAQALDEQVESVRRLQARAIVALHEGMRGGG